MRRADDVAREVERMEIREDPSELTEVSSFTPGISPRRRSSGAATRAAIVSGSHRGRLAITLIVGTR